MHFPAKQPCTNDTWNRFECAVGSVRHPQHTQSIICTRLFRGKMHSDWFNGIEILQGRWQHGEKVGYCYPSGLEKTLCKWDMYVPLVTKGSDVRVGWEPFSKRQRGLGNFHKIMCNRSQVSQNRGIKIPSARSPGRTVAPYIGGSSVWSLLHTTIPAPKILMWFLDFSKTCGSPLSAHIKLTLVPSHGHSSRLLVVLPPTTKPANWCTCV
jgi:hypothetical protein